MIGGSGRLEDSPSTIGGLSVSIGLAPSILGGGGAFSTICLGFCGPLGPKSLGIGDRLGAPWVIAFLNATRSFISLSN